MSLIELIQIKDVIKTMMETGKFSIDGGPYLAISANECLKYLSREIEELKKREN